MKKSETVYNYILSYIDTQRLNPSKKLPSEKAIALRLGVSRETVRNAMQKLKEEDYIYSIKGSGSFFNPIRQGTKSFKSNIAKVGIFLHGVDTIANFDILRGIETSLANKRIGYEVFQTNNTYSEELKCIQSCLSGYSAFVIDAIKSTLPNPNIKYYRLMREKNIGIIFYNNFYPDLTKNTCITIDESKATNFIMSKLIESGHKQIGGIFCVDQCQAMEKYKCFVEFHVKNNIKFDANHVMFCFTEDMQKVSKIKKQVTKFAKQTNIDALICCNELLYYPVKAAIGKEIDIACFDSSKSTITDKTICSIHPGEEMGFKIGEILQNMINKNTFLDDYSYKFDPYLYSSY